MWVQVLGSGSEGGFPAWNDGSEAADRSRANDPAIPRREATALAVSADGERYALLEAPLHLASTLARSPRYAPALGTRKTPIDALVLTSPDLDACAGALALASSLSIRVLSPTGLRDGLLASGSPFQGLEAIWTGMPWDRPFALDREELLEARFFPLPGPTPRSLAETAPRVGRARCGVRIVDRRSGARLVWAPRVARFDSACLAELRSADVRFVDGTFSSHAEARRLRPGSADALALGHAPIDGHEGSLAWLSGMRGRSFYIHLSGTNPACDTKSIESERIRSAGIEVALDAQELSF